jgi:acetyl esterase/lipase
MTYTTRTLVLGITIAAMLSVAGIGGETGLEIVDDATGPGTHDIDFYIPDGADGTAPLVVILHGGGDHGNDGLEALAETVAARGAVVAVPSYFSGQPRSQQDVQDTFETVICSIRYARHRATEFGADPANLTVVGFSYGGYPATALALAPDGAYDYQCLAGISHIPQAVVGLGGAYYYDNKVATLGWNDDFNEFTTLGNLGNNTRVPVSLVHGARDTNSPVDHAESLYTVLEEAGHEVALEVLDTRHAELIDPTDPAGTRSVEAIITATDNQIDTGRTGPATTSVYARLAYPQP